MYITHSFAGDTAGPIATAQTDFTIIVPSDGEICMGGSFVHIETVVVATTLDPIVTIRHNDGVTDFDVATVTIPDGTALNTALHFAGNPAIDLDADGRLTDLTNNPFITFAKGDTITVRVSTAGTGTPSGAYRAYLLFCFRSDVS